MSKHREPTVPDVEPAQQPAAAPMPVKQVPIEDCIDRTIICPDCGSHATVSNARGARTATQVVSSRWWVMTRCSGVCGAKLRKVGTLVTVLPEAIREPIRMPLGEAVGRWVKCLRENCSGRARASWDSDIAHAVQCQECGLTAYPADTLVEIIEN